ncbi:MAG: glycosyltransferase, partial [Lachnospiraceae bacterium]|nr:glycosyltransferase [Lachnospiraceae bacterium]
MNKNKKKALILASVASMIDQFNLPNISLLQDMGYTVDVACNFKEGNTCSDAEIQLLRRQLDQMGVRCYQIDFARNVTCLWQNLKAFWQVEHLLL